MSGKKKLKKHGLPENDLIEVFRRADLQTAQHQQRLLLGELLLRAERHPETLQWTGASRTDTDTAKTHKADTDKHAQVKHVYTNACAPTPHTHTDTHRHTHVAMGHGARQLCGGCPDGPVTYHWSVTILASSCAVVGGAWFWPCYQRLRVTQEPLSDRWGITTGRRRGGDSIKEAWAKAGSLYCCYTGDIYNDPQSVRMQDTHTHTHTHQEYTSWKSLLSSIYII